MTIFLKLLLLILILFLFSACSQKRITVKTLYPSKMIEEKINTIYIENFTNDDVYQSLKIQKELTNKKIDGKKVFNVLNTPTRNRNQITVKGKVDSRLDYYTYYHREIDHRRCRIYEKISIQSNKKGDKKIKKVCKRYYIRSIPCETREYNLQTTIKVLKENSNEILFVKTYNKTKKINQCFRNHHHHYHRIYHDKREVNTTLAELIANDFINDISPHYVYFNLKIIDKLDDGYLSFTTNQSNRFKKITELLENKNLDLSLQELKKLDNEFNQKSYEVIYNMALIYEASLNLYEANKLYKKAKSLVTQVNNIDAIEFINRSILRVEKNLEEKIKAKSQL